MHTPTPINRFRRFVLLALLSAAALPARAAPPEVVVSILPVHSLVAQLMRGVGAPTLLMPAGQSPHGGQLKPSQVRQLGDADLIVWVGPRFEQSLAKLIAGPRDGGARVVTLMENDSLLRLPVRRGGLWAAHEHEHDDAHDESSERHEQEHHAHGHGGEHDEHGMRHKDEHHAHDDAHADEHDDEHHAHDQHDDWRIDPHIWLSVANARAIARIVARELAAIDPANGARYEANLREALSELARFRQSLGERISAVQAAQYVVFHDAYHYFEHEFGLQPLGSLTLSPEQSPGARRILEIKQAIRARGARCVFSEPQFLPGLVHTLAADTGAAVGVLDPLGAALAPGPQAWFDLMGGLAEALADCLE